MAPAEVLERLGTLRKASKPIGHISVTELARSKEWRTELPKVGMIEITDRGQTAGWLVSEEDIEAIVYTVIDLQQELEKASLEALFHSRSPHDTEAWETGKNLESQALKYFEDHGEDVLAVVHDR